MLGDGPDVQVGAPRAAGRPVPGHRRAGVRRNGAGTVGHELVARGRRGALRGGARRNRGGAAVVIPAARDAARSAGLDRRGDRPAAAGAGRELVGLWTARDPSRRMGRSHAGSAGGCGHECLHGPRVRVAGCPHRGAALSRNRLAERRPVGGRLARDRHRGEPGGRPSPQPDRRHPVPRSGPEPARRDADRDRGRPISASRVS